MNKTSNSKRPEKVSAVTEVTEAVKGSDYCFLLNYSGLKVGAFAAIRGDLRKAGSRVRVVKNSYLARAAQEKGWKLDNFLCGPTAMITGSGDPAEVAKKIIDFLKKNESASVKGAQLAQSSLAAADVKALSELPSKDVMRATLLAMLMSPATSLVRVFAAPLTGSLYVLKAKAAKDGGEGSAE